MELVLVSRAKFGEIKKQKQNKISFRFWKFRIFFSQDVFSPLFDDIYV